MIKQFSLKTLESAINFALSLDELMPEKLRALSGQTLKVVVLPLHFDFYMQFCDGEIKLLQTSDVPADTTIYSHPLGLIRLGLLPASKARSLFHDGVRMEGDAVLGQQVKQLFDSLDIDWEGCLARFTGDVVAYQMGQGVRYMKRFAEQITTSWQRNVSDYLHEEGKIAPSPEALRDFCDDVDELVLEVERLEARINLESESL